MTWFDDWFLLEIHPIYNKPLITSSKLLELYLDEQRSNETSNIRYLLTHECIAAAGSLSIEISRDQHESLERRLEATRNCIILTFWSPQYAADVQLIGRLLNELSNDLPTSSVRVLDAIRFLRTICMSLSALE